MCSHLISHASVLKRISKYDGFDKTYCLIALLEFLESIITGVTCRGKPEESALGNALMSLVFWLTEIFSHVLSSNGNQNSDDNQEIVERCSCVLEKISLNHFLMGVIWVAKHEDSELFIKVNRAYADIEIAIASTSFVPVGRNFDEILKKFAFLELVQLDVPAYLEPSTVEAITYSVQPLLAVKVLLNPTHDTQIYVSELLMLQRLKNYSMARLYCEIMRACLTSLYNVCGTSRESIWCAFTFIKVPHLLKMLHNVTKEYDENLDYSPDVVSAFELLAEDPILDYMDTKYACNNIEFLLNEMAKQHLVNDMQVKHLSAKR